MGQNHLKDTSPQSSRSAEAAGCPEPTEPAEPEQNQSQNLRERQSERAQKRWRRTLSCLKKQSIRSSLKTRLHDTRFWKTFGIFFSATFRPSRGSVTDLGSKVRIGGGVGGSFLLHYNQSVHQTRFCPDQNQTRFLPDDPEGSISDGPVRFHLGRARYLTGWVAVGLWYRRPTAGAAPQRRRMARGSSRGAGSSQARRSAKAGRRPAAGRAHAEKLVAQVRTREQVAADGLAASAVERHPHPTHYKSRQ